MEKIRARFQGSPRHKKTKNIDRIRNTAVLAGNDIFLTENITQYRKRYNSIKAYDILIK